MQAREARRSHVVAQSRPNSGHLVRGHRLAISASANDNSTIRFSAHNRLCGWHDEVRVVDDLFGICPEIQYFVAQFVQQRQNHALERESGMVAADGDLQNLSNLSTSTTNTTAPPTRTLTGL